MLIEDLVFAQFKGSLRSENSLYIHSSGTQAIVIDGAPGAGRDAAEAFCYEWLKENENREPFEHNRLLRTLHNSLKSMELRASVAMVTQVDGNYSVTVVGRYFAIAVHPRNRRVPILKLGQSDYLGSATMPTSRTSEFRTDGTSAYILCTLELDRQMMYASQITIDEIKRGDFHDQLAEFFSGEQWTALVFPIGGITNFESDDWPYYPFVGIQEELPHERFGLMKVADALFAAREFQGFKILEPPHIIKKNSSRLLDALLVSPSGVFPIELKHYGGEIELHLGKSKLRRRGFGDKWNTGTENPEVKLRKNMRLFGNVSRGDPLYCIENNDRRIGLLVFTDESARITCVAKDGRRHPLPYKEGDVIICNPSNMARAILQCKNSQHRPTRVPELSTPEQIDSLASQLVYPADSDDTPEQPTADFQIEFENEIESESTDYYTVYSGTHDGDQIWVKEYRHTVLSGLSEEEEFRRLGREVSILQRLNRHRIPGVRYIYGQETLGNALYVFMEPAYSMNLDDWLRTSPIRSDRIEMLKSIASILGFIGDLDEPVIHRAVNPRNIRIGKAGEYQLINFELSQRESLATLPLGARRTFDEMYQAPEMSEHGKQLTPAADVYSFMLCAYFTLAGELPFTRSSGELSNLSRRSDFWPRQMEKLGLPQTESRLWMRALHISARNRPTMDEIISALQTWS